MSPWRPDPAERGEPVRRALFGLALFFALDPALLHVRLPIPGAIFETGSDLFLAPHRRAVLLLRVTASNDEAVLDDERIELVFETALRARLAQDADALAIIDQHLQGCDRPQEQGAALG